MGTAECVGRELLGKCCVLPVPSPCSKSAWRPAALTSPLTRLPACLAGQEPGDLTATSEDEESSEEEEEEANPHRALVPANGKRWVGG